MPLMILPFFILFLMIVSMLRNRSQRSFQDKQDSFWEKEQRANTVRKQDITNLDYIEIPLDTFPIGQFPDQKLETLEDTLRSLRSRKILNLSGISNTDLKLQYGAANLTFLSECDTNFISLAKTITAYGERLAELGHWKEAVRVLEFGVSCKTDVSKNYILLGTLYQEHGEDSKLKQLAHTVSGMDLMLKDAILEKLAP